MARIRRSFTKEFKTKVLDEVDAGLTIAQVARKFEVHPEMIRQWRSRRNKYGDRAFAGRGNAYTDEARVAELERTIGQLTLEVRFLKKLNAALKNVAPEKSGRRSSR